MTTLARYGLTLDTEIEILHVSGVEGPSVYANNYRVAGPKPWGGGSIVKAGRTTRRDLLHAIVGRPRVEGIEADINDAFEWHGEHRRREAPLLIEAIAALASPETPE